MALDAKTGNVLAIGNEAKVMDGKVNPGILTVYPLGDGVISDFDAAEKMIIGFVKKIGVGKRRALKKVLLTKDSQIYTNEGCSRFFDILHFFRFSGR